jgi:tyrosine ammonia-lyase
MFKLTDSLHGARVRLSLGHRPLTLAQVERVSAGTHVAVLAPTAARRVARCRAALERHIARGSLIYGVTTGYGPLANRHISPARSSELQRNLVYHLCSGVGDPLSPRQTRAIMLARANSLAQGHSAIRLTSLQLLLDCLAADVLPLIPRRGTVGASGDLTPLAHLARGLMGEGEALHAGRVQPASEALRRAGLQPLNPSHKEGLALVNGTSAMTGIAALNGCDAAVALERSAQLTVLYAELLEGRREAWSPRLAEVRPHPGQRALTRRLAALARGSHRLRRHAAAGTRVPLDAAVHRQPEPPQDPYTVRCAPQYLGAVADVLAFHDRVVVTELNSVTDNPVFFGDEVVHGGNFYGQHVAFASDALATAVIKLAVAAERRIARITDEAQSRGLPPFLQARAPGLQSGFMGAQVTATALVAEMRTLGVPASIQSIPTNANNQDVVTLGTIAARRVADLLELLFDVLAIEALILTQGLELRSGDGRNFAPASRAFARAVRQHAPPLGDDRALAPEIAALSQALRSASFGGESYASKKG